MTNEEAINYFKRSIAIGDTDDERQHNKALDMAIIALTNNNTTNFKDELKTLVAKRLDEINHFISGCDSPFSYLQIREVQELMCDIRTTLGIEVEE